MHESSRHARYGLLAMIACCVAVLVGLVFLLWSLG
jgi:hypothetical protein